MIRVLSVFGTRPEAIKMAPVVAELGRRPRSFESRVCLTAQHRELLDQVLDVFPLKVHHDLDIMRANQSLSAVVVRALPALESVIRKERPDIVLVQGDTTTAFVGALAAFYNGVPVGHVEAGLRTYDLRNPFPEEANRRFADAMSDVWFAPTPASRSNLIREGAAPSRVHVTGNTVVDALLATLHHQRNAPVRRAYDRWFQKATGVPLDGQDLVLVTGHRRESFGPGLRNVCQALLQVRQANPNARIVYAVHPNPNVRGPVEELLGRKDRLDLLPPLAYGEFVWLLSRARLVISDSGGVQEEAPSLGVPVLVTRAVTERPEAVRAGVATLVGTDARKISRVASRVLRSRALKESRKGRPNPFGDGKAARRIVKVLATRPWARP